jgi:tRNA (guanine-N7-)-methyltransferase
MRAPGIVMCDMQRPMLYGRRKGHRLRPGQARLMQELLPHLRVALAGDEEIDPATLFGHRPRAVWLEIGFGGGEHLAAQAAASPDVGMIGCEPFENGIAQLLARIEAHGLDNIRIHDGDARLILDRLAAGSIARVFLLFPDPWPKRRHHKRRFVSAENLDRLARLVPAGGILRIASDIADYVRWTLYHVHAHGAFEWTAQGPGDWRHRPADWPATRYEAKALEAGRIPAYLEFRRRP